jgi:hypothetical protein
LELASGSCGYCARHSDLDCPAPSLACGTIAARKFERSRAAVIIRTLQTTAGKPFL